MFTPAAVSRNWQVAGAFIAAPQFTSKLHEFQGPKDIVIFRRPTSENDYLKLCVKKICATWAETASLPSGERSIIIVLLLLVVKIFHFEKSILST